MIKTLEGFPEPVIAIAAEGHVTTQDYEKVLIPRVNAALAAHDKVRLYYELGDAFDGIDAGAAWEDFKIGLEPFRRWERTAVVTDVHWIRMTLNAFRFVVPGKLRVFDTNHLAEARSWIKAEQ